MPTASIRRFKQMNGEIINYRIRTGLKKFQIREPWNHFILFYFFAKRNCLIFILEKCYNLRNLWVFSIFSIHGFGSRNVSEVFFPRLDLMMPKPDEVLIASRAIQLQHSLRHNITFLLQNWPVWGTTSLPVIMFIRRNRILGHSYQQHVLSMGCKKENFYKIPWQSEKDKCALKTTRWNQMVLLTWQGLWSRVFKLECHKQNSSLESGKN